MSKTLEKHLPADQAISDLSPKTYKLLKPITKAGVDKVPGDEVVLNDQQAERLRNTGHIA